jgi:Zn-dependent peptidase ImmA (M78 family)
MMNRRTEMAAERVLARFGIHTPAVPVNEIATRMGAIVLEEPLGQGVSGILYRKESAKSVIAVNGSHVEVRRRFSVAHEIGHLELHEGRPIIVDHLVRGRVNMRDERSSLATSREELEANGFAAALLMPADWIAADIEGSLGVAVGKTVESLARRYNVSTQAMEYRLVNLGYRSAP